MCGAESGPVGWSWRILGIAALGWLVWSACAAQRELSIDWTAIRGPDTACLDCHRDVARDALAFGAHRDGQGGLGCLVCHGPHENRGVGPTEKRADCTDCHAEIESEFRLPFRHPLADEGCLDCHPPHGAARRALRAFVREEVCVDCHLEMAGPFLFEHEGDRTRGCLSCHLAHGSANRRLLTHADTRSLCMDCHSNLEAIHVQNPGSIFQNCLLCHTEVHGSNWNRELWR